MKKILVLLCLIAISQIGFAAETVCKGKATINFVFGPQPLFRDQTIIIESGIGAIDGKSEVQLTLDVGGEPLKYRGPIDPNGLEQNMLLDKYSGDNFSFKIIVLSDSEISFEGLFLSSDHQVQGSIVSTYLKCQI